MIKKFSSQQSDSLKWPVCCCQVYANAKMYTI